MSKMKDLLADIMAKGYTAREAAAYYQGWAQGRREACPPIIDEPPFPETDAYVEATVQRWEEERQQLVVDDGEWVDCTCGCPERFWQKG